MTHSFFYVINNQKYMEFQSIKDNLLDDNLSELFQTWYDAENAYSKQESQISDAAFDDLKEEMLEKAREQGEQNLLDFVDSYVYRNESLDEEELREETVLLSLKKIKYESQSSVGEINKHFNYFRNLNFETPQTSIGRAPKFDGCSLKIKMKNGLKIITKGGLDVTSLLRSNTSVRDVIEKYKEVHDCVCGELLVKKKTFIDKYSDDYENPRNFVSAAFHENENIDIQDLDFVACTDGKNHLMNESHWQIIDKRDLYDLPNYIEYLKSDDFPYLCDGIVLSIIENGKREVKGNYPMNMLAVKFPSERARSKVIDIIWSQKKSGILYPVLIIEPTRLMGTTVNRCAAYNYKYLLTKHIGIGSVIEFQKSGDIIPSVVKVLSHSNDIKMPDVEYSKESTHLVAVDKHISNVQKFINGLRNFGIEGIGPELAKKVGSIIDYDIIEIFNRDRKPDFVCLLGRGSSDWNKFSQIYEVKNIFLSDLIYILQFANVGKTTAEKLEKLLTNQSNDTTNMAGSVLADVAQKTGAGHEKLKYAMAMLKKYEVRVIIKQTGGKSFTYEMSGDPKNMTKKEFEKFVTSKYPSSLHTSLKKDTDYLFTNDKNSNTGKMSKARKNNTKIYTYDEVLKGLVNLSMK